MANSMKSAFNQVRPMAVIWIFVALCFLGLLAISFADWTSNSTGANASQKSGAYRFSIAARELVVPASWAQKSEMVQDAALASLQLAIPMDFGGEKTALAVSLLPSSKAAPSAYLLDKLYIHNFDETEPLQQFGLVVKNLRAKDGFEDETVWYDALSASPFVAKCLEEKVGSSHKTSCISTMLVNKRVSALIQFDGELLPYWRSLHSELLRLLPTFNAS